MLGESREGEADSTEEREYRGLFSKEEGGILNREGREEGGRRKGGATKEGRNC